MNENCFVLPALAANGYSINHPCAHRRNTGLLNGRHHCCRRRHVECDSTRWQPAEGCAATERIIWREVFWALQSHACKLRRDMQCLQHESWLCRSLRRFTPGRVVGFWYWKWIVPGLFIFLLFWLRKVGTKVKSCRFAVISILCTCLLNLNRWTWSGFDSANGYFKRVQLCSEILALRNLLFYFLFLERLRNLCWITRFRCCTSHWNVVRWMD